MGQRDNERWLQQVYTPNPQDKMVVTLRQWLQYRAGGGIGWDAACDTTLPPAEYDKDKLFDVWNTHTKDCQHCQRALRRIDQVTMLAVVLAIACFGAGVLLDARAIALQVAQDTALWLWTAPHSPFGD